MEIFPTAFARPAELFLSISVLTKDLSTSCLLLLDEALSS